jgi:mRNA interferase MazF
MKDFGGWHKKKTFLNNQETSNKLFKSGDIWWTYVGLNIGSEEDGKHENFERPVFVLKKLNNQMFIGIPSSSSIRDSKHYYSLKTNGGKFNFNFSQTRVFSSKRLSRRIIETGKFESDNIKRKFKNYL